MVKNGPEYPERFGPRWTIAGIAVLFQDRFLAFVPLISSPSIIVTLLKIMARVLRLGSFGPLGTMGNGWTHFKQFYLPHTWGHMSDVLKVRVRVLWPSGNGLSTIFEQNRGLQFHLSHTGTGPF